MAEEEHNTPDMSEFEPAVPAVHTNKDLWLFLIIIDVVLLCVFGFFLYKNLSAKLLSDEPAPPAVLSVAETVVVEEPVVLGEPAGKDNSIASTPVEEVAAPSAAVELVKEVVKEEPPVSVVAEVEKITAAADNTPADKKESVVVQVNPKSKYRQVTFRYFGPAKEVAVVSGFTMSKPRAMTKKNGVWETTLAISPGTYKYLFIVDGKNTKDPYAPQQDGRSVLVLE